MKDRKRTRPLILVSSLNQVPDHFDSEDEEREWWATHEFSDELYDKLEDTTAELDEIAPLPAEARRSD